MGKELSAGFIIKRYDGKFLACHTTGRKFENQTYDIPKGHVEPGENDLEAAVRELREETGIDINNVKCSISDEGVLPYIKTKDLHIFIMSLEEMPDIELNCSTYFELNGKNVPEINGYEWTDNIDLFFKSLQRIFTKLRNEGKI